ncbi:MAG TPA: GAF domain-containing sensor histidine kinase [Actinomycetota bacterium]
MTERSARRLAWAIWIAGMAMFLGVFAFRLIRNESFQPSDITEPLAFAAVGVVGLIVAIHQPRNAIGWIYLVVWIFAAGLFAVVQEYAYWVETSHASAPGEPIAVWLGNWTWVPIFTLLLTYPFLLFPDGHLPSPRWRPVAWAIAITSALWSITFALNGGSDYTNANNERATNPFAAPASIVSAVTAARIALSFVMIGLMAATVASLLIRYRRSLGDEREQIRWLMLAGGVTVFWFVLPLNHGVGGWADFLQGFVLALIPIAIGVAILKYHLYDIDLVLRKTLVFGVLAVFITLVYVAIVVGVGTAVGSSGNPVLSGIAAAIVALAFQPVRRWGQRLANRLVYGKRATPYEVLSEFSNRLGEAYDPEDVLPRMARILADGIGSKRADVWLHVGGELRSAASWPVTDEPTDEIPAEPLAPGFVPVRHRDELLGALSVQKAPGESLTSNESKLVDDLAAQAGLVLRNVALTEQLRMRLEELHASRQRLVGAQDEERRKIERNIHDGAQQQLVALAVKQRMTASLIGKDDERASAMLAELQIETNAALDDLRDLARGIYPPLLADRGLAAALEAQARKAALPVTVDADGIGRFPQDVEATVYFCTLEALNNVAKYADATRATVRLSNGNGELRFEVTDDGRGFDTASTGYGTGLQGMGDRLAAIGGELSVRSAPGSGTTIAGMVPA